MRGGAGLVLLTFLSDFGLDDEFVGVCRSVIAGIAPDVSVIDLGHAHAGVLAGAAALAQSVPYVPAPAVHLAVVDPGVGTVRRGIALRCVDGSVLVGPDNGLLVWAAEVLGGPEAAVELSSPSYRLPATSATFHGRDVFAPAAAHLFAGVELPALGAPLDPSGLVRLPDPVVEVSPGRLRADVLRADRFGNVQLAARAADLERSGLAGRVQVVGERAGAGAEIGSTFGDVGRGELVVHVDSAGHVAVAKRDGSAADALGAPVSLEVVAGD